MQPTLSSVYNKCVMAFIKRYIGFHIYSMRIKRLHGYFFKTCCCCGKITNGCAFQEQPVNAAIIGRYKGVPEGRCHGVNKFLCFGKIKEHIVCAVPVFNFFIHRQAAPVSGNYKLVFNSQPVKHCREQLYGRCCIGRFVFYGEGNIIFHIVRYLIVIININIHLYIFFRG